MPPPEVTQPVTGTTPFSARAHRGTLANDAGAARSSRLSWYLTAVAATAAILLLRVHHLTLEWRSLIWPAGFVVLLVGFGSYYRRRGIGNFVCCTTALLQLTLFSSIYTILMYGIAAGGRPLIDAPLMELDATMGCHLPSIVGWARTHARWQAWLQLAYDTLLPQTAAVVAILGLSGRERCLETFIQRFMIAALFTAAVFVVLPAAGPFDGYGYAPDDAQQRYLAHFWALRSGDMTTVSLARAEGLITFPSFHTTWAILMALAVWQWRVLFAVATLLSSAVIAATLTTGWHYGADVLGGVGIALLAVATARVLNRHPPAPPAALPATGSF